MLCEICGRKEAKFTSVIEGSSMSTCENCKSHGPSKEIRNPIQRPAKIAVLPVEEEAIVEGYGKLIKDAREKKGLSQKEFSEKISEKESIIHKVESEHGEPPIALAKKIGKFLGISLVEVVNPNVGAKSESKSSPMTIGDNIRIRKR